MNDLLAIRWRMGWLDEVWKTFLFGTFSHSISKDELSICKMLNEHKTFIQRENYFVIWGGSHIMHAILMHVIMKIVFVIH